MNLLDGYIPDLLDRGKEASNTVSTLKHITRCMKTDNEHNTEYIEDIYKEFGNLTTATQDIFITKVKNSDV